VNRCEAVLFLVSKAWIASGWCRKELNLAHRLNKRLFGVLIEDLPFSEIPNDLTDEWQIVRLASGTDHIPFSVKLPITHEQAYVRFSKEGLQRLKHGLEQAGLDPKYFAWPPANDPDRPPYRGLRSLEAEDTGIFFGRDAAVIAALDRLRGLREAAPPRLLVILGASGAGKSSFMRAGLLPRLKRDDRHFLPLPVIRPDRAVISGDNGLLLALEGAFRAARIKIARPDLRATIAGGAPTLRPLLQSLAEKAAPATLDHETKLGSPTLVIAIDQGEELFLADGHGEARAFLALLSDLLREDPPVLIALFTIRSDAYEHLQLAKELEGVSQEMLNLPPMPKGSYVDVIRGPAARLQDTDRRLTLEGRLVDTLLADIEEGGGKDALALLAFMLERLYLEYGWCGQLKLADYQSLKGIKGSIEAAVERAFKEADNDPEIPKNRDARFALLRCGLIPWLAGIDLDTGSPRRRVARQSEIPEQARALIDHLVEQRLLSTDVSNETGERTIEPVHEALLRQWGLLQGWLAEDAGMLGLLEGVKRASSDWAANKKDPAWLTHTTNRLEAAELLISERPDLAANLERTGRDYVAACRNHEDAFNAEGKAAQRRKRRLELAFVTILVLISLSGIAYAIWTNFDYIKLRGELLADNFLPGWPKRLTSEIEREYAEKRLLPGEIITFRECTRCPEMIVVPPGKFQMGSPEEEKGHQSWEGPRHEVIIPANFAVGKFEVTFDEWKACVDARVCEDSSEQGWGRISRPVINVSWEDAQQYVKWLSLRTGKVYRLLSEAEWEYAARAGSDKYYSWGDNMGTAQASCWGCGGDWDGQTVNRTAPVGSFAPNAFGLYDMHGNVWEWVEDCWNASYAGAPQNGSAWTDGDCKNRLVRGGSWGMTPEDLRSATRSKVAAVYRSSGRGIRVARTLLTP
jgi:formylglycine-generating enzyme required for sulfatase activity